nr:MAG TPA: hypothetical protein [Caudoviricetes sp.]
MYISILTIMGYFSIHKIHILSLLIVRCVI